MPEEEKKAPAEGVATEKSEAQVKQEDANARAQAFVKEYGELVSKHKIDFATYPMFVPDGQGGFKIVTQSTPVDISNQPIRSGFMETDEGK